MFFNSFSFRMVFLLKLNALSFQFATRILLNFVNDQKQLMCHGIIGKSKYKSIKARKLETIIERCIVLSTKTNAINYQMVVLHAMILYAHVR